MATLDQLLLARSAQSQKRIQQMSNNMAVEVQLNVILFPTGVIVFKTGY